MIILLGASGYVGTAFKELLARLNIDCLSLSRDECDYTDPFPLEKKLKEISPDFLINAAGYTGKPNVDACEIHKAECLQGNAVLPGNIRKVCDQLGVTWGHVSSGCIFTGRREDGEGFGESDLPNFSFRKDNCSFYSGTKALGEEMLVGAENCYIWRLRIPFDHRDGGRNYLSKLIRYERLLAAENSISHLGDYVCASLDTLLKQVEPGIYNITNGGAVTTNEVTALINSELLPEKEFHFFADEREFMQVAANTPRSNCVMNNSKLLAAGVQIREVIPAIEDSLARWQWEEKQR